IRAADAREEIAARVEYADRKPGRRGKVVAAGRAARPAVIRVQRGVLVVVRVVAAHPQVDQPLVRIVALDLQVGPELADRILNAVAAIKHDVLEERMRAAGYPGVRTRSGFHEAGGVRQDRAIRVVTDRLSVIAQQGELALGAAVWQLAGA